MLPHVDVHRGEDKQWRPCRERYCRDQIVSDAVREICDDVRGRRQDGEHRSFIRKLDMLHFPLLQDFLVIKIPREELAQHAVARGLLEILLRNHLPGRVRHQDNNAIAPFPKLSHDIQRLECCDAGAHADEDRVHRESSGLFTLLMDA